MAARGQNQWNEKTKHAYAPKPKNPPLRKREDLAKDSICYECGETGHWKRNYPQYLAELLKKKKNATSGAGGGSGIFTIELNTFLNRSWIYDTGCGTHICNTTQGLRASRKLKQGALSFAIPRDGIFEIDLSDSYTNVNSIYAVSNKRSKLDLDSALLWHCRLGHISKKRIEKLQHDGLLSSTGLRDFEKCVSCMSGNMARKPYTRQVERAKDLLGLIHTNNKVLVARNAEFLENSLINQKASGSLEDLEIIQEDTHPSIDTSLNHEEDALEIDEPQSDIIPILRSTRTRCLTDRMCLYIDAEEHELGNLDEPANYKADLVELPPNGKTIGSKWLFKKKTDMDRAVHTYKARLVAKGYTQTPWIDYEETFSPVADIRAIRILIAITAFYDYEIWQMDVKTAFLNGYLSEEVYMEQPEGFVNPKYPTRVCKLKCSIYGLKQASRQWNKRFDNEIKKFGFTQNPDESCVYLKASGSNVTFLILYIDDILIMGNNIPMLQGVKSYLRRCFAMKDLGEVAYILGIKIYRSRRLIGLCQSAYIEKILKRYHMENSKRGSILMQEKLRLSKSQGVSTPAELKRMQNVPYASVVGSIMYVMRCTCPDVMFAQNISSRFQQNQGDLHWTTIKNILKYLRNTKDMFLVYGGTLLIGRVPSEIAIFASYSFNRGQLDNTFTKELAFPMLSVTYYEYCHPKPRTSTTVTPLDNISTVPTVAIVAPLPPPSTVFPTVPYRYPPLLTVNCHCKDDFEIVKVRDHVGFYVVGKDGTRTWYPDILAHGEKPIQGTQFVSVDQAYSFYVAYGKKAGFDVRRGGEYKAVGFGDATTKYFHCTREGFLPNPKEKFGVKSLDVDISEHSEVSDGFETFKDPKKKQTRRKPTFRCGCLASLTIKRIGNVFENQKKKISVFIGDQDAQMAVEKLLSRKLHSLGLYANYYKGDAFLFVGLFWADEEAIRNYDTFEAFGKDPEVVVTDQDPLMKITIVECFPDTRHRLYMCHIMMKLGTKVGAALCNRTKFKRRISHIVWTDQISPNVFKREWECMINKFELGENKWLGDMFDLRESWIPAYLRDVHMAGLMRTTSRSESENHFFDEMFASYKYCIALSVVQTENTETYSVRDTQYYIFKGSDQFPFYQVEFCKSEVKLHCSCNRYEAYGLLCRHAFYVLRMNNVKEFPKNYLHKRWLKNVKPSSFGRRRIIGASDVVHSEVLELYQIIESTIDRFVHDLDKLHIYKDNMRELLNQAEIDVLTVLKMSSKAVMSDMLGVDDPDNVLIGNPNLSKVKGTSCFSRMKPVAEVTTDELAKRRTCSVCGGKEGHNKRTCTNEPASKKPKVQASLKEKAALKQQASQPRRSGLRSSTPK
ncbi:retrotransposon protein, putative, ty1-copia subclass [Tanacetum coccineum]